MPSILEKYPWIADIKAKKAAEELAAALASIKDVFDAYDYAMEKRRRVPAVWESNLALRPDLAFNYAERILEGRFIEAEPYIAIDPYVAGKYAIKILKAPWPEAEKTIAKHGYWAVHYAIMLRRRWPPAEKYLFSNNAILNVKFFKDYWIKCVGGRWQQAEPLMKQIFSKPEWYAYKVKYLRQ